MRSILVIIVILFLKVGVAFSKCYTYDFTCINNGSETLWFSNEKLTNEAKSSIQSLGFNEKFYYKNGDMFQRNSAISDGCTFTAENSCFKLGKNGAYLALPKYTNERIIGVKIYGKGFDKNINMNITNLGKLDISTTQTWGTSYQDYYYTIDPDYQLSRLQIHVIEDSYIQIKSIEITTEPNYILFLESFNNNDGTGGNDRVWNVYNNPSLETINSGWNISNSYAANKCALVGNASSLGSITTPNIAINGNAKILFRAGGWNSKNENSIINISVTNGTLSQSTCSLTKETWKYFTLDINDVTDSTKITFSSTSSSNNRFFIDDIIVSTNPYMQVIGSTKYATIGLPYTVFFPNTINAYIAKIDGYYVTLKKISGQIIPANTGIILYGEPGTYQFVATVSQETYDNDLVAITEDCGFTCEDKDKDLIYYIGKKDNKAVFKKLNVGGIIGQYKAYLRLKEPLETLNNKFDVSYADETPDAITNIFEQGNNNQPPIIYNLSGMRVNDKYKGIIIMNGKKVLRK